LALILAGNGESSNIGRPSRANTTKTEVRLVERVAMEEVFPDTNPDEEMSIDRCRELLGDEAADLCDDEIDRVLRCADTVARVVIELFLDTKRPTIH
jgi:hypothetical protein